MQFYLSANAFLASHMGADITVRNPVVLAVKSGGSDALADGLAAKYFGPAQV